MTEGSRPADRPLLSVRDLTAGYGSMEVIHSVDLDVRAGALTCLVGRNGAGKTTTVSAVAGALPRRTSGSIELGGHHLTRFGPNEMLRAGLVYVPAGHRVFRELTARDNLRMGAFSGGSVRRRRAEANIDRVLALFPMLEGHLDRIAGLLSGGQQQMLAIGQALMAEPRILVLDEPTSGLAMVINTALYSVLETLVAEGIGVLVVEQDVERAFRYADSCYVMDNGRIVVHGTTDEVAADPEVTRIVTGVLATLEER